MIPKETRDLLVPLETLPPSSIPESARSKAMGFASRAWKQLGGNLRCTKLGRGSVADVFKIRLDEFPKPVVLKLIRSDSLLRVCREAAILCELAEEAAAIGTLLGPKFEQALSEALRDASESLLREIDFPGEADNLEEASGFYAQNQWIRIPRSIGPRSETGIFMELLEGFPLLENTLCENARRSIARQLFRAVILEPLFSGLPQTIFHGDPHAGNILLQKSKQGAVRIILLDWSQAGRLSAQISHGLIELCLNCVDEAMPSREVIGRVLGQPPPRAQISIPEGGTPLCRALEIIQQFAIEGMEVPASLLLLRKSLLTIEAIARQLDPEFDSWRETLFYSGWVLASETPFRVLSMAMPWLDLPRTYRSGISTNSIFALAANKFVRSHNFSLTFPLALCDSLGIGIGGRGSRQGAHTDHTDHTGDTGYGRPHGVGVQM